MAIRRAWNGVTMGRGLSGRQWIVAASAGALSAATWGWLARDLWVVGATLTLGLFQALAARRDGERARTRIGLTWITGGFAAGLFHYVLGR